ncbi:MAG TPA: adenylyl-sulfate kinase [Candidatus Paceibacterota bacterium]
MGVVLWFTGLSGSGKTTIAEALKKELVELGKNVFVLDGDVVREKRNRHLGFSREDIRENNRIIAELAKEKSVASDMVLVPVISPFREDRSAARAHIGDNFLEVFIDCPLSVCEARDVKGLYKKARAGEIENFIGLSELLPYERPVNPDIIIETDNDKEKEESVELFIEELVCRGLV